MRRRFENVNMMSGNCLSSVIDGSQFSWSNVYKDTIGYVKPTKKKDIQNILW